MEHSLIHAPRHQHHVFFSETCMQTCPGNTQCSFIPEAVNNTLQYSWMRDLHSQAEKSCVCARPDTEAAHVTIKLCCLEASWMRYVVAAALQTWRASDPCRLRPAYAQEAMFLGREQASSCHCSPPVCGKTAPCRPAGNPGAAAALLQPSSAMCLFW